MAAHLSAVIGWEGENQRPCVYQIDGRSPDIECPTSGYAIRRVANASVRGDSGAQRPQFCAAGWAVASLAAAGAPRGCVLSLLKVSSG
jgi:hypothetical protein